MLLAGSPFGDGGGDDAILGKLACGVEILFFLCCRRLLVW